MGAESEMKQARCLCPFCDAELEAAESAFCQACRVTVFYCPQCRQTIAPDDKSCPHCGAEITAEVS